MSHVAASTSHICHLSNDLFAVVGFRAVPSLIGKVKQCDPILQVAALVV